MYSEKQILKKFKKSKNCRLHAERIKGTFEVIDTGFDYVSKKNCLLQVYLEIK